MRAVKRHLGDGFFMTDLYRTLGLTPSATAEEIKRAYRRLAKELHPDRHPDDPAAHERFKEVSAAYAVLGDPGKRAAYDAQRRMGFRREAHARARDGNGAGGGFDFGRVFEQATTDEEFFSDLFGFRPDSRRGHRAGTRPRSGGRDSGGGRDVHYRLTLDFVEACLGTTKTIQLADGKTVRVRIPAGVRDGQQIRLKGQGRTGGIARRPGDALIDVSIAPHPWFSREGDTVVCDLPLSLEEAVLGAKVRVPTLEGWATIRVPKGSSTGRRLRIRGKGIARAGKGARGDLVYRVRIHLPEKPDPALEEAVREWAAKAESRPPRRFEEGD